jgi:proteasome accessory factor B
MAEEPTKTQRWLDLIALLVGRRVPVPVDEIMERVPGYAMKWIAGSETTQASVRMTFERDKKELKTLGIPLQAIRYNINFGAEQIEGNRLEHADFYLPYLKLVAELATEPARSPRKDEKKAKEVPLTEDEAQWALDALRRVADLPAFPFASEARSAFRKLAFDLDLERFSEAPVLWLDPPEKEEVRERLRVLSRALFARKRVAFRYHGIHRGETTEREVEPYGVFFQRDWYLVGHDTTREAVRVFRIARMEQVKVNTRAPRQPDYEIPADFRVESYLQRAAWELGDREAGAIDAAVRFRFPASIQADASGWGELVEEHPDGSAVRRFQVRQADTFARWILAQEGEAEVLSPPELREAVDRLAGEVAALYTGEAAHG